MDLITIQNQNIMPDTNNLH